MLHPPWNTEILTHRVSLFFKSSKNFETSPEGLAVSVGYDRPISAYHDLIRGYTIIVLKMTLLDRFEWSKPKRSIKMNR